MVPDCLSVDYESHQVHSGLQQTFSVFWQKLVMVLFAWSRLVLRFSTFHPLFSSFSGLAQVHNYN